MVNSKPRLYASLLILGASILLARTIIMLFQGALMTLAPWASFLLIAELLIDLGCILASVFWFRANDPAKERLPLNLAAMAVVLHAFRVLVYVVGRVGPWIDFDINRKRFQSQPVEWSWAQVYLASFLSILGLIGLVIIWGVRVRTKRNLKDGS
ncbi:MAG: hypothetical protein WBN18_13385 [Flavobacteriaceae bacterium]